MKGRPQRFVCETDKVRRKFHSIYIFRIGGAISNLFSSTSTTISDAIPILLSYISIALLGTCHQLWIKPTYRLRDKKKYALSRRISNFFHFNFWKFYTLNHYLKQLVGTLSNPSLRPFRQLFFILKNSPLFGYYYYFPPFFAK